MMSNKGFKEYKIIEFNGGAGISGPEIKIKADKEDIHLDSNTSSLNLTGTNLNVTHSLGSDYRKAIHGNFFLTEILQGIQVLGAKFDNDYELILSIRSIDEDDNKTRFKEAYEWNRKIYTSDKEEKPFVIKKNESALTPEEMSKVNTEIWIANYEYDGEDTKQLGLDIYMDEKSIDKLIKYIEGDILKTFNIYIWSERIFVQRSYAPNDRTLDRYLLFNPSEYSQSIFAYSKIQFSSKESVKEEEIITKEEEVEQKEIVIQKEKNYENKLNYILVLLVVIAVGIFLK